jgi:hypothetical protein
LLQQAVTDGRVLDLPSRGQGLRFFQFLASRTSTPSTPSGVTPLVVLLDYALQARRPAGYARLLSSVDVAEPASFFGTQRVSLDDELHGRLGHDPTIETTVRAYEKKLFDDLLRLDTITTAPAALAFLDPSACSECHQGAVSRFLHDDPHTGSYDRLLANRIRPPDFSCLRCHLAGFKAASVDDAPLRRGGAWSMRALTKGITCVSCHTDVSNEHVHGRGPRVSRSIASSSCVTCHDDVNSPRFTFDHYVKHLRCCAADPHDSQRRVHR